MKEKKIITGLIIFNLITISIIFNLLVNKTINSEKQIIKKMSATEYENSITALNTSHENYANQITQYKVNLANAITAKNVPTSADADFDTIINNISQIATIHKETKNITSSGTTDLGATHNVRYITTNVVSKIFLPTLSFSSSCSASSSMGAGSSVSTNTVYVNSSSTASFTFSIGSYSNLSITDGSCSYTLTDSSGILSEKKGTLSANTVVNITGYDRLVLSKTFSSGGHQTLTHNCSASGSGSTSISNLLIE